MRLRVFNVSSFIVFLQNIVNIRFQHICLGAVHRLDAVALDQQAQGTFGLPCGKVGHLGGVLDGDAQTGHAGVHQHDVLPAAQQGDDALGLTVVRLFVGLLLGLGVSCGIVCVVIGVVAQTARGSQIEFADHEVGHEIADEEERHHAEHKVDDITAQTGLQGHGDAGDEFQIAEEVQAQMDDTSHGKGTALQDGVYNAQRHGAEHEHELQRLGHTCKDSPSISRDTKERIRRIMAQMGYEPNFEAEPSEAFSKTIGIILPSSQRDVYENAFHLEIIRGIGQFCNQRRYVNTVITGEDDAEVLDAIQSMVANTQADGFILLYSKKDCPVAAYLRSEGLLHVIVGKAAQSANQTIYIDNDNALAGEEATDYLYEMGHRRIAYFGVSNAMLFSAERKRGYQMSLLKHDITPREGDCVEIDTLNDSYEPALKALLTAPDRPTAVLVSDDILAVVLEQFCSKLGLRIPKDLSIVSFNNSLFSRITNPPLTTVDVNPYQLGIEAASQTINHIENPNLLATKIIVPHQLIVRESCCPPPENCTAALPGGAL